MIYKIYGLADPRTDEIRYVGKTYNKLQRRQYEHIRVARVGKPNTAKRDWILELLSVGLKPKIILIEECNEDNWRDKERYWVSQYTNLLNYKMAGGGSDGERLDKVQIESVVQYFGKISDSRVAEMIGTTRKTISYYRDQMGIPASKDRSRNTPPPPMGGHNKLKFDESLLGTMSDHKLAGIVGTDKSIIAKRRKSLGIKSYAETTGNNGRIKIGEPHRRWSKNK